MTPQQIEAWTLRVADAVSSGRRVEDDRVECKAQWPSDPEKTARRVAGHANAARGASILWVIGVDENQGVVTGASDVDLANWWPQVERCFDEGIAPSVRTFVVPVAATVSVVALYFDTDRAPYLVNTSGPGIERDIPFRSATGVRPAHRHEVLQMVVPAAQAPSLEVIRVAVRWTRPPAVTASDAPQSVSGGGRAFFDAADRAMLPSHRSKATVHLAGPGGSIDIPMSLGFYTGPSIPVFIPTGSPPPPADFVPSYGIDVRSGGVYIGGPGALDFTLSGSLPAAAFSLLQSAQTGRFECELGVAGSDRIVRAQLPLRLGRDDGSQVQWIGGSELPAP